MVFLTIKISLTQFLTFNSKISTSARINCVDNIKNGPEYFPGLDYWKQLRDAIKITLKNGDNISNILSTVNSVKEDKRANYLRVANKMIHFINQHEVEYFETGHAFWEFEDELSVSASPELGLKIDGERYLLKNYYKKPNSNSKVTKSNIKSTLTLMSLAKYDFDANTSKLAVLNLQNGKLSTADPVSVPTKLALNIDAQNFINIWNAL